VLDSLGLSRKLFKVDLGFLSLLMKTLVDPSFDVAAHLFEDTFCRIELRAVGGQNTRTVPGSARLLAL
jgi:hypothetical protein